MRAAHRTALKCVQHHRTALLRLGRGQRLQAHILFVMPIFPPDEAYLALKTATAALMQLWGRRRSGILNLLLFSERCVQHCKYQGVCTKGVRAQIPVCQKNVVASYKRPLRGFLEFRQAWRLATSASKPGKRPGLQWMSSRRSRLMP